MKVEKGWLGRLAVVLTIMALALWLMYSILPSVLLNALYVLWMIVNVMPWILYGDKQKE